jgi:hypothetical protein
MLGRRVIGMAGLGFRAPGVMAAGMDTRTTAVTAMAMPVGAVGVTVAGAGAMATVADGVTAAGIIE